MSNYDEYYEKEDLFGSPYKELIEFFEKYQPKCKVLDVGCGQGRDSVPLAIMGYEVTGIDSSELGIKQMMAKASEKKLTINSIIGDIYSFNEYHKYDIVLLDSMIHFEKRDVKKESEYLKDIYNALKNNSLLCVFMRVNKKNEIILRNLVNDQFANNQIIQDKYLENIYEEGEHRSKSKYLMLVIKKSG